MDDQAKLDELLAVRADEVNKMSKCVPGRDADAINHSAMLIDIIDELVVKITARLQGGTGS